MIEKNKIKVSERSIKLKKLYTEVKCMGTLGLIDLLLQEFDAEIYELKQTNEQLCNDKLILCKNISNLLAGVEIEKINTSSFRRGVEIGDIAKIARNQKKLLEAIRMISNNPLL